ncbi:hypothetical protein BDA96_10G162800 [Sorghum bicolor]|uniref:DUF7769 domain-containing protein n=1 Tax=Sorghum bicolor TaxID=4558 RepID=A0A921U0W7_SORBI|nr:hypothetical protein BDA96_10G162800 [Sorghum bicolor]
MSSENFSGNAEDLNYDYVWDSGNEGTPANIKRRRYYPPDIKRILYAMCLERSAPGMLKEGVTKSVANDMGVPLRVVQRVWQEGKTVKNFHLTQMLSKMCHLDSVILSVI